MTSRLATKEPTVDNFSKRLVMTLAESTRGKTILYEDVKYHTTVWSRVIKSSIHLIAKVNVPSGEDILNIIKAAICNL